MPVYHKGGADRPANERVFLGISGLYAEMGDTIGHFYHTREAWRAVLIPFFKRGVEAGDQCLYLLDTKQRWQELRVALVQAQINVEDMLVSGQLRLEATRMTLEELRGWLYDALKLFSGRFPCLRWGGDMTWILQKLSGNGGQREWETLWNLFKEFPAVCLCQYDLTRLPGSTVMQTLKVHPLCIVGNVVSRRPPDMRQQCPEQQAIPNP